MPFIKLDAYNDCPGSRGGGGGWGGGAATNTYCQFFLLAVIYHGRTYSDTI